MEFRMCIFVLCVGVGVARGECPRYAGFREGKTVGVGHMFGTYMMGFAFADDMNAVHVYDSSSLGVIKAPHGNHQWINEFSNMRAGVLSDAEAKKKHNLRVIEGQGWRQSVRLYKDTCGVLVWMSDAGCKPGVDSIDRACWHSDYRAYDRAKYRVRAKFLASQYVPKIALRFDRFHYNVAWHLRIGDIRLHHDDPAFFNTTLKYLDAVVAEIPMHAAHYVFTEARTWPPAGFEFLAALLPDAVVIHDMSPENTMYHWVNADALVETGSSFTLIASTLSPKPLVFHSCPKNDPRFDVPGVHNVQYISDAVQVSCANHTLTDMSIEELVAYGNTKYRMFRHWTWPHSILTNSTR